MDFTFGIGSALQTVGDLVGAGVKARHERKRDERQFSHNKEMSEYAYSKDLEQWHRANAYNAPSEQMARFREAGLNPRLIYGEGGGGNIAAASLPKYQAPRADYSYSSPMGKVGNVIGNYLGMQAQAAGIDLTRANKNLVEEKTATETFNALLKNYQSLNEQAKSEMSQTLNQYYPDIVKSQLEKLQATTAESLQNKILAESRQKLIDAQAAGTLERTKLTKGEVEWLDWMKSNQIMRTVFPFIRGLIK